MTVAIHLVKYIFLRKKIKNRYTLKRRCAWTSRSDGRNRFENVYEEEFEVLVCRKIRKTSGEIRNGKWISRCNSATAAADGLDHSSWLPSNGDRMTSLRPSGKNISRECSTTATYVRIQNVCLRTRTNWNDISPRNYCRFGRRTRASLVSRSFVIHSFDFRRVYKRVLTRARTCGGCRVFNSSRSAVENVRAARKTNRFLSATSLRNANAHTCDVRARPDTARDEHVSYERAVI